MDLFVYTFHHDGNVHRALSVLDPTTVGDKGIPTESVLGEITSSLPSMTPDQFDTNENFLQFLHQLITDRVPNIQEYRQQARMIGTGILPIIDGRAGKFTGEASDEDLIGHFSLRTGNILPNSYIPNPAYKVLTDNGPIQLHAGLEALFLERIRQLLDES